MNLRKTGITLLITLLLFWFLISATITFFPKEYSRCHVVYNEIDDCIRSPSPSSNYTFESFLTSIGTEPTSGQCFHVTSDKDRFSVPSKVKNLEFSLQENRLLSTGQVVPQGETISHRKYINLNAFDAPIVEFKYFGKVAFCNSNLQNKRHVIIGKSTQSFSLLKAILSLLILIGLFTLRRRL